MVFTIVFTWMGIQPGDPEEFSSSRHSKEMSYSLEVPLKNTTFLYSSMGFTGFPHENPGETQRISQGSALTSLSFNHCTAGEPQLLASSDSLVRGFTYKIQQKNEVDLGKHGEVKMILTSQIGLLPHWVSDLYWSNPPLDLKFRWINQHMKLQKRGLKHRTDKNNGWPWLSICVAVHDRTCEVPDRNAFGLVSKN